MFIQLGAASAILSVVIPLGAASATQEWVLVCELVVQCIVYIVWPARHLLACAIGACSHCELHLEACVALPKQVVNRYRQQASTLSSLLVAHGV